MKFKSTHRPQTTNVYTSRLDSKGNLALFSLGSTNTVIFASACFRSSVIMHEVLSKWLGAEVPLDCTFIAHCLHSLNGGRNELSCFCSKGE